MAGLINTDDFKIVYVAPMKVCECGCDTEGVSVVVLVNV